MTKEKQTKNIYQKLLEARKQLEPIKKTKGQKEVYATVKSSDVMEAVAKVNNESGLLFIPEIIETESGPHTAETLIRGNDERKFTKTTVVKIKMNFKIIDADSGDDINIPWFATGEDNLDCAKAYGKALTYAEKYFFLKLYNIPQDDMDPDSSKSWNQNSAKKGKPANPDKDQLELANKTYAILTELAGGDDEKRKDILEQVTAFTGKDGKEIKGVRSFKDLSPGRLKVAYGKAKTMQTEVKLAEANQSQGASNGNS